VFGSPTGFNPEKAPPALSLSVSSSVSPQQQRLLLPLVPKKHSSFMRHLSPILSPFMVKSAVKSKDKKRSNSSAVESSLAASNAFQIAQILLEMQKQSFNRKSVAAHAGEAAESEVRLAGG